MYVLGSVPYLNARPLVRLFERPGSGLPVQVRYDVPSRLPAMLEEGSTDAVLVSSIEAFLTPERRIAGGVCIASSGPVLSVRLFSKVPPKKIQTLALDQSSLTSNALAQIILAERYGATPVASPQPPSLDAMLAERDACVLIGDIGMGTSGEGLQVLDLGEEWLRLTGLPFVWALWVGKDGLNSELAGFLLKARQASTCGADPAGGKRPHVGEAQIEEVRAIAREAGWEEEQARRYLLETIVFDLEEPQFAGLRDFQRRVLEHGLAPARHFPQIVEPDFSLAASSV